WGACRRTLSRCSGPLQSEDQSEGGPMPRHTLLPSVMALTILLVGCGCMKIHKAEVAHYPLGTPKTLSTVPLSGMYSIRWAISPTAALQHLQGTDALLLKGEQAGFTTDEN